MNNPDNSAIDRDYSAYYSDYLVSNSDYAIHFPRGAGNSLNLATNY